MNHAPSLLLILVAAGGAAFGACGGEQAQGPGPEAPAAAGSSEAPAGSATAPGPSVEEGPFTGPMTPVQASSFASDLAAVGLDAKALPPLSKIDPKLLRKIMPSFSKSLGVKCDYCHDVQDFAAPTPKKKMADAMWSHFVRGLTMADGSPVYCDSCHQGRTKMLDRRDKKALSHWMNDNYVSKMNRRDGREHGCATCHGDPFENDIFGNVWHVE